MIHPQQIESFVRIVPLFADFDDQEIGEVAKALTDKSYAGGDRLLEQGADGALCIVVQGEFKACLRQEELDLDVEVDHFYPGESFGATALIAGRRPYSYVEATSEGLLLQLDKPRFDRLLEESRWFSAKLCRSLARRLVTTVDRLGAVPFAKLDENAELASFSGLLPARVCKACRCLVIGQDGDRVRVGLVDPSDAYARSFVASALRPWDVEWAAINQEQFEHFSEKLHRSLSPTRDAEVAGVTLRYVSPSGETSVMSRVGASGVLTRLLLAAIDRGASDLHLEPGREQAGARIRVDGRMDPIADEVPAVEMRAMISQVKVMCDLDIARGYEPKDGGFTLMIQESGREKRLDVRVSTLPCHGGEKAVLRLVLPQSHLGRLENLIMAPSLATLATQIVQSPSGLVLVTGPTGCGKTTTLYAALQAIWRENPTINIVTIEDPIEYNLPFATQVQINPDTGLTFSKLLRSVLRQDPDVVLVGEIRDEESADLAIGAAITGHLVLSSLHTHSTIEAISRLRQLGVKDYLLSDAIRGVISQKLVPRLLPGAGVAVGPEDPTVERLKRVGVLPEDFYGELRRPAEGAPAGDDIFAAEQGRVGVYEVLATTDRIRRQIEEQATLGEIESGLLPGERVSFEAYSRFLLEKHIVAPERIERLFSRVDLDAAQQEAIISA
ncbi:MAG: ATPase, T2SS/T4P/T4SS family [Planctomycetota bacterium]